MYNLLSLNSAAFCYSDMFNITCKARRKHHIASLASSSFVSVKSRCATGKSDGSDTGISSICWLPLSFQGHLSEAVGSDCAAAIDDQKQMENLKVRKHS